MLLPIETYTFALTRLRYLSAAATSIPGFTPDGKTALYCSDQVALAQQAFGNDLLAKFNAANAADGMMTTRFDLLHDACVSVYACMKSLYRTDTDLTKQIVTLPKEDRIPEKTLVRAKALDKLWTTLPNVPGTAGPMVVGEITSAVFGSMTSDFDAKLTAARLASSQYSGALAKFHEKIDAWNNFVSAGREQGQALYKEGTEPRAIIDRIPVTPSTLPPDQAEITSATSPAAGAAHLAFEADHATSFKVWRKGPGEQVFTEVADVLLPGEYSATGLAGGTYEFYVTGENSRGTGPASAPVTVQVAAAAVA